MIEYLKVKVKSLAAEARIIRKEEGKSKNIEVRLGLQCHRTYDVRREARAALLAYACVRGVPYSCIEKSSKTEPSWTRIQKLYEKYGDRDLRFTSYSEWIKQAKDYYESNKKTT